MAEHQLPKLRMRVRFPSPALGQSPRSPTTPGRLPELARAAGSAFVPDPCQIPYADPVHPPSRPPLAQAALADESLPDAGWVGVTAAARPNPPFARLTAVPDGERGSRSPLPTVVTVAQGGSWIRARAALALPGLGPLFFFPSTASSTETAPPGSSCGPCAPCEATGLDIETRAEVHLSQAYARHPAVTEALTRLSEMGVSLSRAPGGAHHELLPAEAPVDPARDDRERHSA